MFHGGWWQEGSIDDGGRYAAAIVAAGGAHVAVGYTLAPAASLREIVDEAAAAVATIAATASQHGADPARIVVAGHSAGAHLAASLITALAPEATRSLVAGLLLVGGIYDLPPLAESYVNEKVGMSAGEAAALSPAALQPLCDVPIALRVGEREPTEFHRNAALLVERWAPSLTSFSASVVADRDHFDVLEELDHNDGALLADAVRLLGLSASPAAQEGGAAEGDGVRG
jgi:arylformamidase